MYLKLLDVDKWVSDNNIQEVTDPTYLQNKKPTPDGLFSYQIFGVTNEDRKSIWAYIDLGTRLLHPLAAINFKKYSHIYENIIYALKKYKMVDGEFVEDPEGETGIDFLYDNYDNIKWRETESLTSNERISFLKQGKDKLFITKYPVCPPYYRDLNSTSTVGVNIVNDMYRKLISRSGALRKQGSFNFFSDNTKAQMQRLIVNIHDYYIGMLKGKTGMMRKFVMGRNVDYGSWCVLASPTIDCERYEDMMVDFDHMGIPLPVVLSIFKPFILEATKNMFANEFIRKGKMLVYDKERKENKLVELINPALEFSEDRIDNEITSFINGYSTRFKPIEVPENKDNIKGYLAFTGRYTKTDRTLDRPLTWTDIFYQVAEAVTANKSVVFSRYPINQYQSIEYPKVRVLSTINTEEVTIDNITYKWYPKVVIGRDSSSDFVNTAIPNNVNIQSLNADYDGDSCPVRSIFTTEGNLDAERFRRDKKNFLDLVGRNIRCTERDMVQLLYSLTKSAIMVPMDDPN